MCIFFFICNDGHMGKIFCRGPDHGRTTNINFFNDRFFFFCIGNSFFKWIKVYNHQVDFRNPDILSFPSGPVLLPFFPEYLRKWKGVVF